MLVGVVGRGAWRVGAPGEALGRSAPDYPSVPVAQVAGSPRVFTQRIYGKTVLCEMREKGRRD